MRFFGDWEAFWREGFDIESFGGDGLRGGEYDIAAISKGAVGEGVGEALEFAYMRYEARKRIGRVSLLFWGEDSIDFSSWESRLLDLLDYGVEMEIFITASQPNGEELAEFFRAFGVVYWFKSHELARELFASSNFDIRREGFIKQVE